MFLLMIQCALCCCDHYSFLFVYVRPTDLSAQATRNLIGTHAHTMIPFGWFNSCFALRLLFFVVFGKIRKIKCGIFYYMDACVCVCSRYLVQRTACTWVCLPHTFIYHIRLGQRSQCCLGAFGSRFLFVSRSVVAFDVFDLLDIQLKIESLARMCVFETMEWTVRSSIELLRFWSKST